MKSIQHDDESHEDELSSKQAENWRGQVVNSQAIVMMSEIHGQIGVNSGPAKHFCDSATLIGYG